jgi:hypothetical protein
VILELKRKHGTIGFTHGDLFIDGVLFCNTIEDEERQVKIAGATAIACGNYQVIINRSNRFKRLMPLLLNVANFEGVRIHNGNTAKDTEGCLLVGTYLQQGYISNSRVTFAALFKKMQTAIANGEKITLKIV